MAVDPAQVFRTATELLRRHGRLAVGLAEEQAQSVARAGDYPALDVALMVLTEVERRQGSSSTPVM
ncbi:MAG: hypothetical protein EPN20_06175 [Magnetospirillum sp.]|nr:MAG: hypothetical protein EPN20_06175 [Magnetospirillum sp.]